MITLELSKDGWTGGLQLSINDTDAGHGYRLMGPKFNGSSKLIASRELDERDVAEIRAYLDAFAPTAPAGAATGDGDGDE